VALLSLEISNGQMKSKEVTMGSHANVCVVQHPGHGLPATKLFLYAAASGSRLPEVLRQALIRGQEHWTNEPYLARIIFSEMIRDQVESPDGFGISVYMIDHEYPILVVDCLTRTVGLCRPDDVGADRFPPIPYRHWEFSEYIITETSWDKLTAARTAADRAAPKISP
jgi:hypothetical protein